MAVAATEQPPAMGALPHIQYAAGAGGMIALARVLFGNGAGRRIARRRLRARDEAPHTPGRELRKRRALSAGEASGGTRGLATGGVVGCEEVKRWEEVDRGAMMMEEGGRVARDGWMDGKARAKCSERHHRRRFLA